MKFPNKYLRNLKPYRLASHKIWTVDSENRAKILKLDWNEATIPPTPLVNDRICNLLQSGSCYNLYPSTYNSELHELLASYVQISKENVQYFASSDALHEYICKVFISVGDPVLILGPSYDNFRLTCQANGADVYFSKFDENFSFNSSAFESDIINIEPAVVYICNPNNPTGYVHSKEYVEHLLVTFPDTLFLVDEAYYEFSGVSCKDLVLKYDNILISRTMSKAFALANFRFGYLIGSKDNVQFVNRIRNPKNITTFAQEAAIAALSDVKYMRDYVEKVHEGMEYFIKQSTIYSDKYEVYPSSGNFLLLKFPTVEDKSNLVMHLANNNIFVRDLTQDKILTCCFRITIGTPDQMKQVFSVFKSYYE